MKTLFLCLSLVFLLVVSGCEHNGEPSYPDVVYAPKGMKISNISYVVQSGVFAYECQAMTETDTPKVHLMYHLSPFIGKGHVFTKIVEVK